MSLPVNVPSESVTFVPAKAGDIIKLGPITCRVMEDGSHTGKSQDAKEEDDKLANAG